jgi:hypothetical protein
MRGRRRCGEVRDGARDLSPRIAATAGLILPHFYVDFVFKALTMLRL